jgi:hypothetical protein
MVLRMFRAFFMIVGVVSLGNNSLSQDINFSEILGRPTNSSVTISVLFDQDAEVYWEYGTEPGSYPFSTDTMAEVADTAIEADFVNLTPDTKYYYRTRYLPAGTSIPFFTAPERSFHTQRAPGSNFTFTVEADEHMYDKKGNPNIYKICLANQALDEPDFMISLGDIFGDDHTPFETTSTDMDSLHKWYRPYLGSICHSVPFYVCLGNHEGENNYYLNQTPPENIAVYATKWRKFYYPNPFPNDFYSGNTDVEPYDMGNPENYYAWTWGDALFVVLDAYRYQCDTSAKPKNWAWTLGFQQYTWLKNTLENSNEKYKFVFCHQIRGQGRGGVEDARYFEWGGYEANGTNWGFSTNRPGWDKPIHQLFVDNHVTIFFHGHDHLFAREELDGVIYQEIPMPSDSTYELGMLANADAYVSDTVGGTGHLRVSVSPSCVRVDFIQAYLPADTIGGAHHNRNIAFSYGIGDCPPLGIMDRDENIPVKVFPNPARDNLTVVLPDTLKHFQINLINIIGQTILQTQSNTIDIGGLQNGIYFINIKSDKHELNKKVIIYR